MAVDIGIPKLPNDYWGFHGFFADLGGDDSHTCLDAFYLAFGCHSGNLLEEIQVTLELKILFFSF
jgi:hypothetical protein